MPSAQVGVKGPGTSENGPEKKPWKRPAKRPEHDDARWAARNPRAPPTGHFSDRIPASGPGRYLSQASTLTRLSSTHFFAAASGVILSTAMYLATMFWSSLVQLKFFTRS